MHKYIRTREKNVIKPVVVNGVYYLYMHFIFLFFVTARIIDAASTTRISSQLGRSDDFESANQPDANIIMVRNTIYIIRIFFPSSRETRASLSHFKRLLYAGK